MIWHLLWFAVGAFCGVVATLVAVAYALAGTDRPRVGKPRHP